MSDNVRARSRSRPKPRAAPSGTFNEYLQIGTGKSLRRIANSEEKLAVISKAFKKTLQPIANLNVRDLITTPPDDIFEKLSKRYDEVHESQPQSQQLPPSRIEEIPMPQYQPLKSGSMKAFPVVDTPPMPTWKKKGAVSQSANVSRTGSKNLAPVTNFHSLLALRPDKESDHQYHDPSQKSKTLSQRPPLPAFPRSKSTTLRKIGSRTFSGPTDFKSYVENESDKPSKEQQPQTLSQKPSKTPLQIFSKKTKRVLTRGANVSRMGSKNFVGLRNLELELPSNKSQHKLPQLQNQILSQRSSKTLTKPPSQQMKGTLPSQSANVSRTGSKNLAGLMDLNSLLAIQSDKHLKEHLQPNLISKKSTKTLSNRPSRWIEPSANTEVVHLTGTEVHGTLQRSVKSIDQAAKIAQNLGNLMSKVALQQNGKEPSRNTNNDNSLRNKELPKPIYTTKSTPTPTSTSKPKSMSISTSTNVKMTSKGVGSDDIDPGLKNWLDKDRKRNPYNPITDEIKKRADRLAVVVEQAEQNLKLHGAAFGLNDYPDSGVSQKNSRKNSPRIGQGNNVSAKRNSVATFTTSTSTGTDAGFQTEMEKLKINEPAKEFEFVNDMSYTDQLMLKKLRALKSTWKE